MTQTLFFRCFFFRRANFEFKTLTLSDLVQSFQSFQTYLQYLIDLILTTEAI